VTALSLKTYVSRLPVSQVIFALPPKGDVDYTMRIYNSDGSEPEMCGNGIRCLARFVAEKDNQGPRQYKVLTGAGKPTPSSHPTSLWLRLLCSLCSICQYLDGPPQRSCECCTGLIQPDLLEDGQVCVDMGEPILQADRIPTTLTPTQVSRSITRHNLYSVSSYLTAHQLLLLLIALFIAGNDNDGHVVQPSFEDEATSLCITCSWMLAIYVHMQVLSCMTD